MIRDLSKVLLAGACVLAFSAPALAGSFTILHKFKGGRNDGMNPYGPLTPDGQMNVIYTFGGDDDGQNPSGNLVLNNKGNLYGVTIFGGHSWL